jgi:hypothetical protein
MTTNNRILRLEHLIKGMRKRLSIVNAKMSSIIDTRNHYLRHRAPAVLTRQRDLVRAAVKMADKLKAVQRLNIHTTHATRKGGKSNVLLLVTPNQARKLRAIADSNLRHFLNSKDNARHATRITIPYGTYKPIKESKTWSSKTLGVMRRRKDAKLAKKT